MLRRHPQISAELRAGVVGAGIRARLRLQIEQDALAPGKLIGAIERARNAAISGEQPHLAGHDLHPSPDRVSEQRPHPVEPPPAGAPVVRVKGRVGAGQLQGAVHGVAAGLPLLAGGLDGFHGAGGLAGGEHAGDRHRECVVAQVVAVFCVSVEAWQRVKPVGGVAAEHVGGESKERGYPPLYVYVRECGNFSGRSIAAEGK